VQTSAKHLLSLINDLLDLAKIESGKLELNLEPVVCQSVMEDVATALRPAAENKGLSFEVAVPPDEIVVRTDRRALNQISSTWPTTPSSSPNRARCAWHSASGATAGGADGDHHRRYRRGHAGRDQARLFQAFAQLGAGERRRTEGTGLACTSAKKLAELLAGQITLQK